MVAAFDNWEPAINLYKENFSNHPIIKCDLASSEAVSIIESFSPDFIMGGPPCQDFSSAGKRDEKLGRADLTIAFSKIISKIKPKYFLMENVDRALKSKAIKSAIETFKKSGYGLTVTVLNACYCGVPQSRKRLFIVGVLGGGGDDFLLDELKNNLSNKKMTLRNYFGDSLNIDYYYRHPRSYKRRGVFSIDEPSPTVRGVNRPVPCGYPGHASDSVTLNDKIRPLTSKERSMIQTFPEKYILIGNKTDVEQVIGNAVPVNLAKYVAKYLKKFIENSK